MKFAKPLSFIVVLHMWHFVAGFPQGYVTKAFF
jgi:hypothetical protein